MAFTRPSLTDIRDRIESDFKSGLLLQTILRRSFVKVLSAVIAGVSHVLHGHVEDFAVKQPFVDTQDEDFLLRTGEIYNLPRNQAIQAELNVSGTGVDSTALPLGTLFQRIDGVEYSVKAEVIVVGGVFSAVLVAEIADDNSNVDDGSTLTITSAIPGIDSDVTVDSTAVEGEDEESIEAYRTRLIERIQAPPSGGTVTDYIAYAKTVTGVTRVWILPSFLGQGTVGVTFVEDDQVPIFPSAAKVSEVQLAVDELKPITADVTVFAPNETVLDLTIQLKPNTTTVQAAVIAELEDLIFREAQVRGAIDPAEVGLGTLYDGKIPLSRINEAISIAAGEEDHILENLTSDPQAVQGGILSLGTVTFKTLG